MLTLRDISQYLALLLLLIVPLAALTVLWALALKHLPAERRRGLLPAGCAMFAAAALLFGGEWILERFGLAWRFIPVWTLALLLWCLGWAAGIITARYTARWVRERRSSWGDPALGLTLFCLLAAMFMGTILGGFWVLHKAPSMEQVGEYEGRTVVQAGIPWDGGYYLYEYHGPLIRGEGPFEWSESPYMENLKPVERALGLDLSAGEARTYLDTHDGFLGDGVLYAAAAFPGGSLEKQLVDWKPLPLPPEAERLRKMAEDGAYPIPPATDGLYWVRDEQNKADPSDGSHIFDSDRGSYNCALAVYDRESRTLYYYELDT